jgi:hypothetical protein
VCIHIQIHIYTYIYIPVWCNGNAFAAEVVQRPPALHPVLPLEIGRVVFEQNCEDKGEDGGGTNQILDTRIKPYPYFVEVAVIVAVTVAVKEVATGSSLP